MAVSIFSRKRDLLYLINFSIAIPIAFLMDFQAIYPPSFITGIIKSLGNYYVNTYKDQFFVDPPVFLQVFIWSEVLYQLPVMVWSLGALIRNDPKTPLFLLPHAVIVFLTTLTCMVDFAFWPQLTGAEKLNLASLYGPYLALSAFMLMDMLIRINNIINRATAASSSQKKRQ